MSAPAIGRKRELKWVPIEHVIKNERNPREESKFRPEELEEMRVSIREHGILDPLIVTPYDELFKLIDGERRYTSAKLEGIKEIPAYVVPPMSAHEEVVTMFNLHMQHRGWTFAEEMRAIRRLVDENGQVPQKELAKELGMSLRTLKDRLDVLEMGPEVERSIAKGEIKPYVALRAGHAAKTVATHRPEMSERLGGVVGIQTKLVDKGRHRGEGMTRELEQIRDEARDVDVTPDAVLEAYIEDRDLSLRDARRRAATLEERRAVEDLAKRVENLDRDLRLFKVGVDLSSAPNLRELRRALARLAETAADLEARMSEAMRTAGVPA